MSSSSSNYQDFQRFQPVDLAINGDAQASLPVLIGARKRAASVEPQAHRRRQRGD